MEVGGAVKSSRRGAMDTYRWYAGLDWASQSHRVQVLDAAV
jgi:hypothetical protein